MSGGGWGEGGGAYISNSGTSASVFSDDVITGNQAIGADGADGSGGWGSGGGLEINKGGFGSDSFGAPATITNTTIAGNIAQGGTSESEGQGTDGGPGFGGGIEMVASGSNLLNDTFYGNVAAGGSGFNAGSAWGGAIDDDTAFNGPAGGLSLVNVTITSNSAQAGVAAGGNSGGAQGGGIDNGFLGAETNLFLTNTLDAGNTAISGPDFFGPAAHTDRNLIGDSTDATGFSSASGDLLGTAAAPINPLLGPLQNNGGTTTTVALLPGSPALGAGDPSAAAAADLTTDQRGLPRAVAGEIDIGAFETQPELSSITTLGTTSNSVNLGQSVTLTATVSAPPGVNTVPTGTVTFSDAVNGTVVPIGSAPLIGGVATFQTSTLPVGSGTVNAAYSGDTIFNGSGASQSETVLEIWGNSSAPSPTVADSTSTTANNLRAAIAAFNTNASFFGNTILLQSGTYALTLGSLQITNSTQTLTIQGAGSSGPNATIIDQLSLDRVFDIAPNATVILEDLEITGGLGVTDPEDGTTEADGGGLLNQGNLTLTNVAVVGNKAIATAAGEAANGGGLYSNSTSFDELTIGGGSLFASNSVIGGTDASNFSIASGGQASGGGIAATGETLARFQAPRSKTISPKAGSTTGPAPRPAAAVSSSRSRAQPPSSTTIALPTTPPAAAAARISTGPAAPETVVELMALEGSVNISNSTISGNTAQGGVNQGFSPTPSTFAAGGGILAADPTALGWVLTNDTIFGNQALASGGESAGEAYGGGIEDGAGGMSLVNVTIASNTASAPASAFSGTSSQAFGGGIDHQYSDAGNLSVQNTLIAGNTAATGPDVAGQVASTDHNLIGNASGALGFSTLNGDLLGTSGSPINPQLGPLGNNGGNTATLAPLPGSPAIGAGDPAAATTAGLTTDQRGLPRIVAGTVDVGAFETQVIPSPVVTSCATTENTQSTSGLVITPGLGTTIFFQIAGITGGTLYQADGITPIVNGAFITITQGAAGLKFTPTTGSLAAGGFTIQQSTTGAVGGLIGVTVPATINVTLSLPSVTPAATTVNTQTTSGLVITPGPNDASAAYFQITNITGGTLYLADGVTPIAGGSFITLAQGAAGLRFTPTTGSLVAGSFNVQQSTTSAVGGLSGPIATAVISVSLVGPSVTGAATTENTQTASGLVIKPGVNDGSAAYFQITNITGGRLYQNDGITPIAGGSFITLAQGAAGLKFTPTTGSLIPGSFNVQESTTAAVGGLSGATATAAVNVTLAGPSVTNSVTTANTQTTSGLVITPGANDGSAAYYQITYITGGTLYQNNGTTPIPNGSFITLTQAAAGLKFTPTSAALVAGGFTVRESTTSTLSGLSGATARAAIAVTLSGPKVTNITATENTQLISGLVIKPGPNDSMAAYFQITNISGGTLYQADGVTPIVGGTFITLAQGAAGLKFAPTPGSLVPGSFNVQESTTGAVGGLNGATATVSVNVMLAGPTVTNAATKPTMQTTSGLVITPGPNDSSAGYFQITYITGGTLYLADGVTQITNGTFITLAQGEAGLKFSPTTAALVAGGFTIRESTTNAPSGLSGPTARAAIGVALNGPRVTGATTTEGTQSTSGLVIKPGASDGMAAYFQITDITGGTLYQNNGTTPIVSGSFITLVQGAAGLKFTPTAGSLIPGSFNVQESTTGAAAGLSGPTATATINLTLAGPSVTNSATTESTQTTSGLVITPGTNDSAAAYFQITYVTGGTLYQNNGTTPIPNGSFITLAQGEAGLKFTPTSAALVAGGFTVRESTTSTLSGLSGATARAAIAVTLGGPRVINTMTTEDAQSTSGLVIKPGPNDSMAAYFQITHISGGTLYQSDGVTPIANGAFITLAQGAAGLKFTPTEGSLVTGSFNIQESTTAAVGGLNGATTTATVNVALAGPTVTNVVTTANTQTTSGLVLSAGPNDISAVYFQITYITGGTLYLADGVTQITNGSFITLAQGAAGLKFTPTAAGAGQRRLHHPGVDDKHAQRIEWSDGQGRN